jgi:hypothetical protein
LSSSRSTRSSRNPKGSGKPKTPRDASDPTAFLTQLSKIAEDAIMAIAAHQGHLPAFLKMSLFARLAANIPHRDTLHQVVDWVHPGPGNYTRSEVLGPMTEQQFRQWTKDQTDPKPWQHEG